MIPQVNKLGPPEPGFYRMRLVKAGPWVPVKIWLEDGDRDPETNELMSDQVLRAKVGDKERDPLKIWTSLWDITEEEYYFLLSRAQWAVAHDPTAPEANPKRPIRQTDVALDMPAATIYRGTRPLVPPLYPSALAVTVHKQGLDPYQLPVCLGLRAHNPDGFECGSLRPGSLQLALALLADHLGDHGAAVARYQGLAARVVAHLPRNSGWKLSSDEIDRALEKNP
jgi:hypothetical protein